MATPTAPGAPAGFPCSLVIDLPFPSARLARIALRALAVDAELSPLVRRAFSLASAKETSLDDDPEDGTVLRTRYEATTNRMLRVAVNGFLESAGVVVAAMRELDVDVAADEWAGAAGAAPGADGETAEERDVRNLTRVQGLAEAGRIG